VERPRPGFFDACKECAERNPTAKIAVYTNVAMDSHSLGHQIAMAVGPDQTHKTPPKCAPDGPHGLGWKYLFDGYMNLETGVVEKP
jgi:hypothetical protein